MTLVQFFLLSLVIWNLIVFTIYGLDKQKAKRGAWRISEKTLLLISLCLGGLGALVGGYFFHHKTRKWYFQVTWYLGLILDIIIIYFIWQTV